ncbi:MAG: DUF1289 domain-containing protein [Sphingomonadaceae bacterium]
MTEAVESPCTRCCTLDCNNICLGCGRTIDEIMEWGIASGERRRAILAAISARRAKPAHPASG